MRDGLGFILSKQDGKLERSPNAILVFWGNVQEEEPTFFAHGNPSRIAGGENKFKKKNINKTIK